VNYQNLHAFSSSFGDTSIDYEYKVSARPMHQVKQEMVLWKSDALDRRIIESRKGILVTVKVRGTFGFFSLMNFMLMLTTAAALLTLATVLTDRIATSMLHHRDFFFNAIYEQVKAPPYDEADGKPA